MGLGFLSSQSSINLFFVTVHPAPYEDLIPYVYVAHDLESLVRSTVRLQQNFLTLGVSITAKVKTAMPLTITKSLDLVVQQMMVTQLKMERMMTRMRARKRRERPRNAMGWERVVLVYLCIVRARDCSWIYQEALG
jgi:hypothetical protein